jgi:hypothetical protein
MEALTEKYHYFQPFHPPQWTRTATTPAIGRVLSPAADPHYWTQHDAIGDDRDDDAAIMEHRTRADTFLKKGDIIVQQMPATEPAAIPLYATSIKRKRKLKMNKHKRRKLRKRTRALRKRLGKI